MGRGIPARGRVVGGASPQREQLATLSLFVGLLGVLLPIIVALFATYAGNVVALALAVVVFFMVGRADGTPALSAAGKRRVNWARGLAIVIALVWIALIFAHI